MASRSSGLTVTSVRWRSNDDVDDNITAPLEGAGKREEEDRDEVLDTNVAAKVYTSSGKVISARHAVVLTLPLGVLQGKSSISFEPPLPASHLDAIDAIGVGHSTKVFLHFASAFWPNRARLLALVNSTPVSIGENDHIHNNDRASSGDHKSLHARSFNMYWSLLETKGEPVLVTAATGQAAIEIETWSEQRLKEAVLAPLEAAFGESTVRSAQLLAVTSSAAAGHRPRLTSRFRLHLRPRQD